MKNPRVLAVLFANFMGSVCLIFMDPILVLRLQYFGVGEAIEGLGFALMAFTFTLGAGLIGDIAEKAGKRLVIIVCSVMIAVALWLVGGLSIESSILTWIGLGLNGLFVAGPIILPIPEIIESVELSIAQKSSATPHDQSDMSVRDPLTAANDSHLPTENTSTLYDSYRRTLE